LRLTTADFDLSGNRVGRVFKHWAIFRLMPFGGLAGGPGLKNLVLILLTHRLGALMAWGLVLGEERLRSLHRRVSRRIGR